VNISWKKDTLEGKLLLQWDYEFSLYFFGIISLLL